jgi:hypothetical protein
MESVEYCVFTYDILLVMLHFVDPKFVSCKVSHLTDELVNIVFDGVFKIAIHLCIKGAFTICMELDSCII